MFRGRVARALACFVQSIRANNAWSRAPAFYSLTPLSPRPSLPSDPEPAGLTGREEISIESTFTLFLMRPVLEPRPLRPPPSFNKVLLYNHLSKHFPFSGK